MNSETLNLIITFVVGIIMFLVKSPFTRKYIPGWVANILAQLTPDKVDELIGIATNPVKRRETAIDEVRNLTHHIDVELDEVQAGELIDWVVRFYKKIRK